MVKTGTEVEVWRLPYVCKVTGLSKPSIYRMMKEGNFPSAKKLNERAVGWISTDVTDWIQSLEEA